MTKGREAVHSRRKGISEILDWASCELRCGELMGFFIALAVVMWFVVGWVGTSVVVIAYFVTLMAVDRLNSHFNTDQGPPSLAAQQQLPAEPATPDAARRSAEHREDGK